MSNQTAKRQTAARAEAPSLAEQHPGRRAEAPSQAEQHLGRRAEVPSQAGQHSGRRAETPSQAGQHLSTGKKTTSPEEQKRKRRVEVRSDMNDTATSPSITHIDDKPEDMTPEVVSRPQTSASDEATEREPYTKQPDMELLTQEIADLHTRINELSLNNEINQQGARDCIAVVAHRDANLSIDNYKVHLNEYLNQSQINITNVTNWDGMSDAIQSIGAEISAAVQANFLTSESASQVQNMLRAAQENAKTQKPAEVQWFLNDAKRQLEEIATEVVKNVRTELDDTKNTGDVQERAKRSRGWLGIFAAIVKIILAIEYVSKLVPLLVWLI